MSPALDLGYRIMCAGLGVYAANRAWRGWTTRRIRMVNDDWLDWSRWSRPAFHRDVHPGRYWMLMIITAGSALGCFAAALIGWWEPGT